MPIGVFDSGLGGLTVLGALRAALPVQDFIYFGDNANAPFGTRGADEIHDLTRKGVERLFAEGCDLVILACNTGSAVALRRLQEKWLPVAAPERRVLGVFVPVIEALTGRPWAYDGPPTPAAVSRVALFATPATVASDAFPRELRLRASGLTVTQQACPGLVDALEAGDDAGALALVRRFCEAASGGCGHDGGAEPEVAVLGCTHYPLVESAFRAALAPAVRLISQPRIVAESLADYLRRHPRFAGESGGLRLLTSGDPALAGSGAEKFLGARARFEPA
ncbi:MAG: glutamate racemase [Alphaproteobacteria bacterium]